MITLNSNIKYSKRVKELIKVIKYQMEHKLCKINLHLYTDHYNLYKSQILQELDSERLLEVIEKYNKEFIVTNN